MKFFIFLIILCSKLSAQEIFTEVASPQVIEAAVRAVNDLGGEIVKGKYELAGERMYLPWKKRVAERSGGMKVLEEKIRRVSEEMLERGISITNFSVKGQPQAYEVSLGTKIQEVRGQEREVMYYKKWLVIVPTVTHFRTLIQGDPVAVNIESKGFQIAISDKQKDNWTFIDGSSVRVSDLRSFFINLPPNLKLPPLEKHRIP